ncbi:MAG: flippase-like domain-containing protein [Muribaculaceae bacterium]|nr:flippase-like domain-containing protein [Muribaculaceae bacterium]
MSRQQLTKLARNSFKYIIPLVISIGLCYLLFTDIDFNEMIAKIKDENNCLWWIGLALFLSIFSHIIRAMRWRIQLRTLNINSPLNALVNSIFGTYAVNLVFPRLGELWRTGYISQRQGASFPNVFGSMVAERFADTITVLTLTVITFLLAGNDIMAFIQESHETYDKLASLFSSPYLWLALAAVSAFLWWFFTHKSDNSVIRKTKEAIKGLWQGFAAITRMKNKGRWLILTLMLWGCYFLQLYVAFYAFPETAEALEKHGTIIALVCFVLSSISMGVPSNGGIGPWQFAVIFALHNLYGIDKMTSVAFANLVLGAQTCLLILLGLYTFASIAIENRRKRQIAQ